MAFRHPATPLLVIGLSLICSNARIIQRRSSQLVSVPGAHGATVASQHQNSSAGINSSLRLRHVHEVKHDKEAGEDYAHGSPLYNKQVHFSGQRRSQRTNAGRARAKSKRAVVAGSASAVGAASTAYMIPVVLAYVVVVSLVMGLLSCIIMRGRAKTKNSALRACRLTDKEVERMEELREARKATASEEQQDAELAGGPELAAIIANEPVLELGFDVQGVPRATLKQSASSDRIPSGTSTPRSSRRYSCAADWDEFAEGVGRGEYFSIETDTLVDCMGLSGMSLLEMDASSGISGLSLQQALPACALQAWFLQSVLLFYMARRVGRLFGEGGLDGAPEDDPKDVPISIIVAAIYLHFMNCVNDLPFAFSILTHIGELHDNRKHLAVAMPVFIVDGIIVPFTSLLVGAFYLCTSLTVSDVILNSCAVAFISNIDNWILQLNEKLNTAAAAGGATDENAKTASGMRVFVPVNLKLVKNMSWWICIVPFVPAVFSCVVGYVGLIVLRL